MPPLSVMWTHAPHTHSAQSQAVTCLGVFNVLYTLQTGRSARKMITAEPAGFWSVWWFVFVATFGLKYLCVHLLFKARIRSKTFGGRYIGCIQFHELKQSFQWPWFCCTFCFYFFRVECISNVYISFHATNVFARLMLHFFFYPVVDIYMSNWRVKRNPGPTLHLGGPLILTLMCALALLSRPRVVWRLQSGPRGMRAFNRSRHSRRWARLWRKTNRMVRCM